MSRLMHEMVDVEATGGLLDFIAGMKACFTLRKVSHAIKARLKHERARDFTITNLRFKI